MPSENNSNIPEEVFKAVKEYFCPGCMRVCDRGEMSVVVKSEGFVCSEKCIFCGVCAARCPVGAITLVPGEGAVVNDLPNARFVETPRVSEKILQSDRALIGRCSCSGLLLHENDDLLLTLESRLKNISSRYGDWIPNILSRNLLLTVGLAAGMKRKGNNSMRMDIIFGLPAGQKGLAEVEFGAEAILDAPRDVLDASAILISRYKWPKSNFSAAIIGDVLPNRRSEYWRILKDIYSVLKIRISTISLLALYLLVWNRKSITDIDCFYADCDTKSYRHNVIEAILKRPLRLSRPSILLESTK